MLFLVVTSNSTNSPWPQAIRGLGNLLTETRGVGTDMSVHHCHPHFTLFMLISSTGPEVGAI